MDQSSTVALTKKLIRDYYEFGNIVDIRQFTEDVVAFGIKSECYSTGLRAVEQFLRKMHRALEACRVNKMSQVRKKSRRAELRSGPRGLFDGRAHAQHAAGTGDVPGHG